MLMLITEHIQGLSKLKDLNTSHVNVNPTGEKNTSTDSLFKYISC